METPLDGELRREDDEFVFKRGNGFAVTSGRRVQIFRGTWLTFEVPFFSDSRVQMLLRKYKLWPTPCILAWLRDGPGPYHWTLYGPPRKPAVADAFKPERSQ